MGRSRYEAAIQNFATESRDRPRRLGTFLAVHATPRYPSELSRRSRLLDSGRSYTISGLLSDWGYRLGPGTYRVYVERSALKHGAAGLEASTTLTVH
jgi:hypothetical protein